jgi:predicted nucleic acid-binding Zn ribbon protein
MSGDVVALIVGTILGVGALAFVLYPLFFAEPWVRDAGVGAEGSREDSAIVALREIEFDRATGKLSEADYADLRAAYATRALRELRTSDRATAEGSESVDPIEARVRAYRMTHRECPACGLRPEPDAIYCSTCGGFLDRLCPACSTPINETSATFCSACGVPLAHRTRAAS